MQKIVHLKKMTLAGFSRRGFLMLSYKMPSFEINATFMIHSLLALMVPLKN